MKRKVIKLAQNTLVVSLPAQWVRKISLNKGDEINIHDVGETLILSSSEKSPKLNCTVDAGNTDFNKNLLSYLYQKGFDEIEIFNIDSKIFNQIHDRIGDLMGYEVIEHGERRCVIRAVAKGMEGEFQNLLRRTFFITIELGSHLHEALLKKDFNRLSQIRGLEKTTNTFTDFCKRILSKGTYSDPENTMYMYVLVRDLEKVADGFKYICDIFSDGKKQKISGDTLSLLDRTNQLFKSFHKVFYTFEKKKAEAFRREGRKIVSEATDLLKQSAKSDAALIANIIYISRTLVDMLGPCYILNFQSSKVD